MSYENGINLPSQSRAAKRPNVTSYDSGHEHSYEHLMDVRRMVEEADRETIIEAARAATTT
jgi:hypothetical protein